MTKTLAVLLLCLTIAFSARVHHSKTYQITKIVEHEAGEVNVTGGYS